MPMMETVGREAIVTVGLGPDEKRSVSMTDWKCREMAAQWQMLRTSVVVRRRSCDAGVEGLLGPRDKFHQVIFRCPPIWWAETLTCGTYQFLHKPSPYARDC